MPLRHSGAQRHGVARDGFGFVGTGRAKRHQPTAVLLDLRRRAVAASTSPSTSFQRPVPTAVRTAKVMPVGFFFMIRIVYGVGQPRQACQKTVQMGCSGIAKPRLFGSAQFHRRLLPRAFRARPFGAHFWVVRPRQGGEMLKTWSNPKEPRRHFTSARSGRRN